MDDISKEVANTLFNFRIGTYLGKPNQNGSKRVTDLTLKAKKDLIKSHDALLLTMKIVLQVSSATCLSSWEPTPTWR
jgi:hypothetical protein